jgi:hypothetical protein
MRQSLFWFIDSVPKERTKIARHFNAGINPQRFRVPQGRQKFSVVPAGLGFFHGIPGVKTPGYSRFVSSRRGAGVLIFNLKIETVGATVLFSPLLIR